MKRTTRISERQFNSTRNKLQLEEEQAAKRLKTKARPVRKRLGNVGNMSAKHGKTHEATKGT